MQRHANGKADRGGQASPGQRVPIDRLMKQTTFAAELVQPYDGGLKNRFVR